MGSTPAGRANSIQYGAVEIDTTSLGDSMWQLTSAQAGDWRRHLRRSIGWMLLVKVLALSALWALFFSPSQRMDITADQVDSQLVIEVAPENPRD